MPSSSGGETEKEKQWAASIRLISCKISTVRIRPPNQGRRMLTETNPKSAPIVSGSAGLQKSIPLLPMSPPGPSAGNPGNIIPRARKNSPRPCPGLPGLPASPQHFLTDFCHFLAIFVGVWRTILGTLRMHMCHPAHGRYELDREVLLDNTSRATVQVKERSGTCETKIRHPANV